MAREGCTVNKYKELQYAIDEITEIAKTYHLDFYPMRYEVCPPEIIYTFGAYGMPSRFTHWSFGKLYHKMKLHYDLGLSTIYELVINSNPCYAFLLNSNSLIQNKLIIAHVLAHSDFFKNNYYFKQTRSDMVESMAASSERFAYYEEKYGKEQVEKTIDAVLSIQEHIDSSTLAITDDTNKKDLLLCIALESTSLEDWQRDIVITVREEMLYFWPQLITKIMNEGWASYWHQTIIRDLDLSTDETIEFAKLHANVVQPSTTTLNPYYLGIKLFEHIEATYDNPTEEMKERGIQPGSGRDKIFDIRATESDISFIRNYLSKEFMKKEDMYLFQKQRQDYVISDQASEHVKQQLVQQLVNGGFPTIYIKETDYLRNGELYLHHQFEGIELDIPYLEKVLEYIYYLWDRAIHIETVVNQKSYVYSYDGNKQMKRAIF